MRGKGVEDDKTCHRLVFRLFELFFQAHVFSMPCSLPQAFLQGLGRPKQMPTLPPELGEHGGRRDDVYVPPRLLSQRYHGQSKLAVHA